MGRGRNEWLDEFPFLQLRKLRGQIWLLPIGCGCVSILVWFSLFLSMNQFAGVVWEREAFFAFPKQGHEYIKPLFSSSVYIYQHTHGLHLIKRGWREKKICSQFIKLTKEKNLSQLICQQQWNNSFSLGKVNANNNSHDSGNRIVPEKGDFQLLALSFSSISKGHSP